MVIIAFSTQFFVFAHTQTCILSVALHMAFKNGTARYAWSRHSFQPKQNTPLDLLMLLLLCVYGETLGKRTVGKEVEHASGTATTGRRAGWLGRVQKKTEGQKQSEWEEQSRAVRHSYATLYPKGA